MGLRGTRVPRARAIPYRSSIIIAVRRIPPSGDGLGGGGGGDGGGRSDEWMWRVCERTCFLPPRFFFLVLVFFNAVSLRTATRLEHEPRGC